MSVPEMIHELFPVKTVEMLNVETSPGSSPHPDLCQSLMARILPPSYGNLFNCFRVIVLTDEPNKQGWEHKLPGGGTIRSITTSCNELLFFYLPLFPALFFTCFSFLPPPRETCLVYLRRFFHVDQLRSHLNKHTLFLSVQVQREKFARQCCTAQSNPE